jgi:ribosomal protein L1
MNAAQVNMLVNRFAEDKAQIEAQLVKAVGAIQKYAEKKQAKVSEETGTLNLLPEYETITLSFAINRIPTKKDFRFHEISCPNPVIDLNNKSVCLFSRDPKENATAAVAKHQLPVEKIVCVKSLKRKYVTHEARRELANRFDFFFCEHAIYEQMGKLLGRDFLQLKKAKIPIALKSLTKECFEKAVHTARFRVRGGCTVGVRIGHRGMEAEKLVQNAMAVAEFMATKYCLNERTKNNISNIAIGGTNLVDLPIWSVPVAPKKQTEEVEAPPETPVEKEVVPTTPENKESKNEKVEEIKEIASVPIKKLKQIQKQRIEEARAELAAAPARKKSRK